MRCPTLPPTSRTMARRTCNPSQPPPAHAMRTSATPPPPTGQDRTWNIEPRSWRSSSRETCFAPSGGRRRRRGIMSCHAMPCHAMPSALHPSFDLRAHGVMWTTRARGGMSMGKASWQSAPSAPWICDSSSPHPPPLRGIMASLLASTLAADSGPRRKHAGFFFFRFLYVPTAG